MNTTNLFVELVVIGVGVFIWFALLVFALFGVSWFPIDNVFLISSAIPALAFIYVLGIIWDRIVDFIFHKFWGEALRKQYFESIGEYYNDRRNILTNSKELSDLLEYGRSRLRICRGWSVNALMIGACLNIFLWRQNSEHTQVIGISLFGSFSCLILAISSWFAWRNLTKNEYRKIKEQSGYLSKNQDDA